MHQLTRRVLAATALALLAGCATHAPQKRGGAYYQDDGPGDNTPSNLDQLPDATPRVEPYLSGANRPYTVFGHEYVPVTSDRPFSERGVGSWYGRKFNGQRTSSGEIYDMYAMTAAHPTLPIPSYARVTNVSNGRSVIVRINDRGPFHSGRIIDLSYAAANRLGYVAQGSTTLEVERLLPRDIQAGRYTSTPLIAAAAPESSAASAPAPISSAAAPRSSAAALVPAAPIVATAASGGVASGEVVASSVAVPNPAPVVATTLTDAPAQATRTRTTPIDPDVPPDLIPEADTAAPLAGSGAPLIAAPAPGLYLQLGAFHQRAGADDFMRHIARELDATLAQRLRIMAGDSLYRVQIGPYGDRGEAENAAQHVRDDFGFSVLIVTTR